MYPKQKALEQYLKENNIDVEVDMSLVGNLEMVCDATLKALQAGTDLPRSVKLEKHFNLTSK